LFWFYSGCGFKFGVLTNFVTVLGGFINFVHIIACRVFLMIREFYTAYRWRKNSYLGCVKSGANVRFSACAVTRRRFSSGCKAHPAIAPAGSNRGRHGGDEMSEAPG
jgi:purine-cytosine permease-like protein